MIAKCKATQMGLTVTTLADELVEVDDFNELFDLLSDLSDAAVKEDMETDEHDPSTPDGQNKWKDTTAKGNVEINMSNEVLLQLLVDKGLLQEKPSDLLKQLHQNSSEKPTTATGANATTTSTFSIEAEVHT